MTEAYPLQWPIGWHRTQKPQRATFRATFATARNDLFNELRLLGARNVVLSTNVELRRDGLPYASRAQPEDRGIAVYFILNNEEQCIPCDKWDRIEDNLRAVVKTIDALRGLERWGAKEMVDAAFRGFKALPSATPMGGDKPWWEVLGVSATEGQAGIKAAYLALIKTHHPDMGGDHNTFIKIQRAYEEGMQ